MSFFTPIPGGYPTNPRASASVVSEERDSAPASTDAALPQNSFSPSAFSRSDGPSRPFVTPDPAATSAAIAAALHSGPTTPAPSAASLAAIRALLAESGVAEADAANSGFSANSRFSAFGLGTSENAPKKCAAPKIKLEDLAADLRTEADTLDDDVWILKTPQVRAID